MLLLVFWGSLGLVLGALGGFFGAIFVLLRALGARELRHPNEITSSAKTNKNIKISGKIQNS